MNKYGFTEREMFLMERAFGMGAGDLSLKLSDITETTMISILQDTDRYCPREPDVLDAQRFRWLLDGNGYFLEEQMLCGHSPVSDMEKQETRDLIDNTMWGEQHD